ncbi:MAG: hypothetical protein ACKVT0_11880 [Planctomycetaceae bacterium]
MSIPDIGPIFGNEDAYIYGKVAGTVVGIGTSIAIGAFGPGLVQCGSLGAKLLVAWEVTNAVGDVATAAKHYSEGNFGWGDALGLVGAGLSMKNLGSIQCFVYPTPLGLHWEYFATPSASGHFHPVQTQLVHWLSVGTAAMVIGRVMSRRHRKRREELETDCELHDRDRIYSELRDEPLPLHSSSPVAKEREPLMVSHRSTSASTNDDDRDQLFATGSAWADSGATGTASVSSSHRVAGAKVLRAPDSALTRRETKPSRKWSLISVLLLLFGGFCYWQGLSGFIPGRSDSAQATSSVHPRVEKRLVTAPIGSMRLGRRIIGENPQLAGQDIPNVEPNPAITRHVSLFGPMGEGWFTADCLFSLAEIEQLGLIEGETVDFSVSHIELDKPLLVKSIRACPEIEPDDGTGRRVVTAIYRHLARDLIDVQIEGEPEPIGCTPGHPFWSVNRDEFVPAVNLQPGEWVKTAYERTARVISLAPRGPPSGDGKADTAEVVYNLEVSGQHVYHVGTSGIVVHNVGCDDVMDLAGGKSSKFIHDEFVQKVRPGAKEKVFETPWSTGKGLGSRKFDDYDETTSTAFEGNTTPWSRMNHDQLSRKLNQVGSDFALSKTEKAIKKIIWFGTEELPTSGIGARLREALHQSGIAYWVVRP